MPYIVNLKVPSNILVTSCVPSFAAHSMDSMLFTDIYRNFRLLTDILMVSELVHGTGENLRKAARGLEASGDAIHLL